MIKVTNDYLIDVKDRQYTVLKKAVAKESGKEYLNPICYPSTLDKAVERIMQLVQAEALGERDMALNEALEVCKQIKNEFADLLEQVKKEVTL